MSNIVSVKGVLSRSLERRIGDMVAGEVGYAVEWAVDDDGGLREDYTVSTKGGTSSLRVECIEPHRYEITYEATHGSWVAPERINQPQQLTTWERIREWWAS